MNKITILILSLSMFTGCGVKEKKNTQTVIVNDLASPAKSPSGEPYLFTDKSGTTYLSWIEQKGKESAFKYAILTGNEWSQPLTIDSGSTWFVNWADYPMIATNGKAFMAHYLDKSGANTYAYDIKLTSSQDGRKWSEPTILHDDGKQAEHGFVSIVPYQENFFASWLDGRNTAMEGMDHHTGHHGDMSVRAAILANDGTKVSEWELDKRVCDCCQTSAAITANGPVVVYRDRTENEVRDMSIVRLIDGRWTEPTSIHDDNWKIAGCPVNGPRVSANGNNLVIAWFTMQQDQAQVKVLLSTDGGASFGEPVRVDEGSAIGRVDAIMMDDGSAMVSWMEGPTIKVVKVYSDGRKDSLTSIATSSDSRSSGFPQMTLSKGRLIFAWTDDKEKTIKTASISL